jgi:hypothetical protein
MNCSSFKSVAQLRALAGALREQADNANSSDRAEQMLRTASEFDKEASQLENQTPKCDARHFAA